MTTATSVLKVAFSRPILLMVAKVYIPVLFPLTFLIALSAVTLDRWLGFEAGFLAPPWHLRIAAASFVTGALLWLFTYEQLVVRGEGSPSPTAGRTLRLER